MFRSGRSRGIVLRMVRAVQNQKKLAFPLSSGQSIFSPSVTPVQNPATSQLRIQGAHHVRMHRALESVHRALESVHYSRC